MTIKEARKLRGWTQSDLSVASGVSRSQIQKIELGTNKLSNVSAKIFFALTKALEVDPRDLMEGIEWQN